MDRFLNETQSAGEIAATDQVFTLSGERARQHFLTSVPPNEQTLLKGLLFLADALTHLGHNPSKMVGFYQEAPANAWVHMDLSAPAGLIERGPAWIEERYQHPFTSKEPADLAWDRAWLRLLAANQIINIAVKDAGLGSNWSLSLDPKLGLSNGSGIPLFQKGFYMAVGPFNLGLESFKLYGHEERLRAGRRRALRLSDYDSLRSEALPSTLKGNWFDYRSRHLCLHERLVLAPPEEFGLKCTLNSRYRSLTKPLYPSEDLQTERIKRPGFIYRVLRSGGLWVAGRSWSGPTGRPEEDEFWAKAIFNVALDERPSSVDFFNDGHSLASVDFPEGPKGLLGVVYWPELQSDLWGQNFVHNSEWERAMAWTKHQLSQVQRTLEEESNYLVAEVVANHTKKVYRKEVEERIRRNWFSALPDQAPSPERGAQEITPEERAEEIRRRLKV